VRGSEKQTAWPRTHFIAGGLVGLNKWEKYRKKMKFLVFFQALMLMHMKIYISKGGDRRKFKKPFELKIVYPAASLLSYSM